jgi:hypothetical protein
MGLSQRTEQIEFCSTQVVLFEPFTHKLSGSQLIPKSSASVGYLAPIWDQSAKVLLKYFQLSEH